MTTPEQLYREALEKIAEMPQGTLPESYNRLYQVRMIARRALAQAAADALDPWAGPGGAGRGALPPATAGRGQGRRAGPQ